MSQQVTWCYKQQVTWCCKLTQEHFILYHSRWHDAVNRTLFFFWYCIESSNPKIRWAIIVSKNLLLFLIVPIVVVQSLLFLTLCKPWTGACQTSLSFTVSWSLLKLMPIELVMPSNHLILCHSLLLLPSIFPSIRVFSNEGFHIRWPKYWSFSFSISPSNEYSGLISSRTVAIIIYNYLIYCAYMFILSPHQNESSWAKGPSLSCLMISTCVPYNHATIG